MKQTLAYRGGRFLTEMPGQAAIFTPEDFTAEHRMIGETAKRFLEKEVRPHNESIESQDFGKVKELMRQAGELGLLAHSIPEAYGGLELDKISKGLVGEKLGAGGAYSVAQSNHTCIATLPITYFGTEKQKQAYLPKLATGEFIGAYCLTEPEAGSDALNARTTARLNEAGTHYVLNGTKVFITNAEFSDTFITYAKVDGKHFTAFIVEKDYPGLSLGPEEQKMGIKGSSTRPVLFEDCEVPTENLLGEVGKGHQIALNVLNLGRFNLGSACVGAAKYALELTLRYTRERKQFGKAIADFPATKEKISNLAVRLYAAESLQYRTAGYLEDALGGLYGSADLRLTASRMAEYAMECAICKVYSSETLDLVADEALQLHGGYGFIKEYKIEQIYRDSRINRIFEGTNEINRLLIPMNLLKLSGKGAVPLQDRIFQAQAEMEDPKVESIGELSRELEAVRAIRRVFLLCTGLAHEHFGEQLMNEQEVLFKLADLGILLYAAESAVFRTNQALKRNGADKEAVKLELAKALIDDSLLEAELTARKVIRAAAQDQTHAKENCQAVIHELTRLQREDVTAERRQLADWLLEAGQYKC